MRIAILGGSFDPVHNGHLAAARAVATAFQTTEVRFVPTYVAPHKPSGSEVSAFHRFAMVALAISAHADFRISTIEVDVHEKQYTVDTIARMRAADPHAQFIFVMGTDMYRDFDTWKDYRRLMTLTHIAVANRPGVAFRQDFAVARTVESGETVTLPDEPAVFYLPFVEQPVSSTGLRDAVREGQPLRDLVPESVANYIQAHDLYA